MRLNIEIKSPVKALKGKAHQEMDFKLEIPSGFRIQRPATYRQSTATANAGAAHAGPVGNEEML